MKKAIYVMLLLVVFTGLRAQQQGKVRVGFNAGVDVLVAVSGWVAIWIFDTISG
jgi:hypothetical protein